MTEQPTAPSKKPRKSRAKVHATAGGILLNGAGPKYPAFMKSIRRHFDEGQTVALADGLQDHIMTEVATKVDVANMSTQIERLISAESVNIRGEINLVSAVAERNLNKEITDLKRVVASLETRVMKEITDLKRDFAKEITDLKKEFAKEITDLKKEFAKEITDLKKDFASLEARVAKEITELKRDINRLESRMDRLESSISEGLAALEAKLTAKIVSSTNKTILGVGAFLAALQVILRFAV